jgi:hypothetical protein
MIELTGTFLGEGIMSIGSCTFFLGIKFSKIRKEEMKATRLLRGGGKEAG